MTETLETAPSAAGQRACRGAIPSAHIRAFGASDLERMPDAEKPDAEKPDAEKPEHRMPEANGGGLMMSDCRARRETGKASPPRAVALQLVAPAGDGCRNRAVEAGRTVRLPLQPMFRGDRWGLLVDPFGVEWAIDAPGGRE